MNDVNRRSFLQGSLSSAACPLRLAAEAGAAPLAGAARIIDVHVYASRWPFRRIRGDGTPELVAMLRQQGVAQAWAGTFDGLLHKDMSGANVRLARECEDHGKGFLLPFGALNPKLPDWEEDLRRCQEQFHMPGIRLHPNYHNYTLGDPDFGRLLRAAAGRGLMVQIAAWMEDERTQNPLVQAPMVDLSPLPAWLESVPTARLMVLNGFISVNRMDRLLLPFKKFDQVAFDFAKLEGLAHLSAMVALLGVERVVFGSYSPMFYFESAALKIREAALTTAQTDALLAGNARRLLA